MKVSYSRPIASSAEADIKIKDRCLFLVSQLEELINSNETLSTLKGHFIIYYASKGEIIVGMTGISKKEKENIAPFINSFLKN